MANSIKLSRAMQKTIVSSLKDAMQIHEQFVDRNGEFVDASLSEIASALIIEEAMPFDEDKGVRVLGNYKILKDILDATREEEGDENSLDAALERVVNRISERKKENLIAAQEDVIDAEIE